MGDAYSIYGKSFLINPGASVGNPDAKWPDPVHAPRLIDHPERYYSRAHAEREWRELWSRTWNIAGRESDVAKIGDFFRFDLGPESFLIVRDDSGTLRAFHNVCQHRGSQLVDEDFGHRKRIVCPFHSWCWALNGKLQRITDRETFDPEIIKDEPGLSAVRCETWGGFVFINLDPTAIPLLEYLSALPGLLDPYQPQDMIVVKDVSAEWPINWKIGLDAFLEGYHAHSRHPELIRLVDDYHFQHDLFAHGHSRMIIPIGLKSPRFEDQDTLTPELGALLAELELNPADFTQRAREVRGVLQQRRREWGARFGLDYTHFTDSQISDDWNFSVFPNITFNAHPEGILVMRFRPHATDPELCHYDVWVLARKVADSTFRLPFYMDAAGADLTGNTPRPVRLRIKHGEQGMGDFLDQDGRQLRLVQRGVRSRGFKGLRLSRQEIRLRHFYETYAQYCES